MLDLEDKYLVKQKELDHLFVNCLKDLRRGEFKEGRMSDPFDWPADPHGLRCLDEAMRCRICGDFYQVPISLQCGHCCE